MYNTVNCSNTVLVPASMAVLENIWRAKAESMSKVMYKNAEQNSETKSKQQFYF